METRTYTQKGSFSVAVLLPFFIVTLVLFFVIGFDEVLPAVILGFVSLTFFVCLLIFYRIVITIDEKNLSFKLGTGIVKKSYPLSEISSCIPVRNPVWYGVGIRLTPNGWLYNVSGLRAIELTFKNKKEKIRIGTDMPEEVAAYVSQRIVSASPGTEPKSGNKPYLYLFISVLFLAFLIPAILIMKGNRDIDVTLLEEQLKINGMYSISINYSEISSIDTVGALPGIKARTNGFATGQTLRGHFKLDDGSKVRLYVKKHHPPYIAIRTKNATIWMNFKEREKTVQIYREIVAHR